ncbi:MAG: YggT family protein [Moraxella sp.]|nr:YggT family protein [Moraxella sp.]
MNSPLYIVFHMVVNFATLIIFLRFLFDFADIDAKHPYTKAMRRISAVVDVFSSIFKPVANGRINTAAVVLLILLSLIKVAGMASLLGKDLSAIQLFFLGTYEPIIQFLTALRWTILASVLASWVVVLANKMHPVIDIIMQLSEPIIAPFRRISPTIGMIDLSALVALLSLALMTIVLEVIGANIGQAIGLQ